MEQHMGQPGFAHEGNGDSWNDGGVNGEVSMAGPASVLVEATQVHPSVAETLRDYMPPGNQKIVEEGRDEALRDRLGRYAPGNIGGPGNPHGRRVALLRRVVLDCVTPEKMKVLIDKLYGMAAEGDKAAMKLLLAYAIGKPEAGRDPDRVEVEEWKLSEENPQGAEFRKSMGRMPACVVNVLDRALNRLLQNTVRDGLEANARKREEREKREADQRVKREEQAARRREKKEERRRRDSH